MAKFLIGIVSIVFFFQYIFQSNINKYKYTLQHSPDLRNFLSIVYSAIRQIPTRVLARLSLYCCDSLHTVMNEMCIYFSSSGQASICKKIVLTIHKERLISKCEQAIQNDNIYIFFSGICV